MVSVCSCQWAPPDNATMYSTSDLLRQVEGYVERRRQRRQEHPFDALERGGQGVRVAEVAGDRRHAVGQVGLDGVLGQRADIVGAQVDQMIHDAAADVACSSGHKNGHEFHGTCDP